MYHEKAHFISIFSSGNVVYNVTNIYNLIICINKWVKDSKGWCYVGANGYCLTNKWVADSKGWCFLDADGRMVTNKWLQYNGEWYFIDANGYMVTGTKVINGKTYNFASNGVWIA